MDSSGSGSLDCGVGSIVWVRRRNGSWWPGQILGPEELSSSHLTSPRSGTPVKLLGREDASVDWYNLEKSKRVKAFRCGEFDDCIERAESSQGMPIKKREKYARREDAILHALELERQLLKKQGKLGIASDQTNRRSSNGVKKGLLTSPEPLGNDNEKHSNLESHTSCPGNPFPSDSANTGVLLSGEEDHSETIPHMKGLLDLGHKIAPLKGKLASSVDLNVSDKLTVDDSSLALARSRLCLGSTIHTNGVGHIGEDYRGKRSRFVYMPAESSDSLDYKETPSHVEMAPSHFGGEGPHPSSLAEQSESAFMDGVGSDSSDTGSTDSDTDSDSSETEPDMDQEMTILSGTGRDAEEHGSTSSEEPDELAISTDMPHLYLREPITSNEAVSKWQLKGKRNNRHLIKRPVGTPDGQLTIYGADAEGKQSHLSHKRLRPSLPYYKNDFIDVFDEADQMFGLDDDYSPSYRAVSKGRNKNYRGIDWDDWACEDQPVSKGYWDVKGFAPAYGDRHHFGGKMRSLLINVDLKVQASYRKEPVPIVSLMSKVDGKAIIGHPIQVEVLQDGSTDSLVSAIDDFNNDGTGIEGSSMLPPAWRTARRTANFRVPRPHVSSTNGAEASADLSFLDQERRPEYKKLNSGNLSHKASMSKKSGIDGPWNSTDKKSSRKAPKKASLSSSQKTRTLSSLSIEHNLSKKPLHDSSNYQTNRLIKPEVSGPPTVACIPVKLVFSRLLEKINRPPLKSASNAALLNAGVERNS